MARLVDRRARVVTAVLAASALVLAGAAVAGSRQLADAKDRAAVAEVRLADQDAAADAADASLSLLKEDLEMAEVRLRELRRYFTADAVAAVSQLQSEMEIATCAQARAAVRDGSVMPMADAAVILAVAGGQASKPALAGLGQQWGQMLDPFAVQAQIDSCSASEQAKVEAEQQAARERRQAAEAREQSSNCNAPLFAAGACPSDVEVAAEQQAERLCGGARYDEAAELGIDCGVP